MKVLFKFKLLLFILVVLCTSNANAIELKFGNEIQTLSVKLEHDADEFYGKPLPLGPSSLRFYDKSLWVSDSLAGRLVEYDSLGKFKQAIKIDSADVFPGDFCLSGNNDGGFWVVDVDSSTLLKIDKTGKVMQKFSAINEKHLIMPMQLELLPNGNLLLLDAGIGELIELDSSLQQVTATVVFGERFALDDTAIYYLIEKDEKISLTKKDLKDGSEEVLSTGFTSESYPALQALDDSGNAVISFVSFDENAEEEPAFYLTLVAAQDSLSLGMNFPPHFLVRNLISNSENQFYIINFDETGLSLHKTELSFSLEGSDG